MLKISGSERNSGMTTTKGMSEMGRVELITSVRRRRCRTEEERAMVEEGDIR